MPNFALAARGVSIAVIVACAAPCLEARAAVPERRSGDMRTAPVREPAEGMMRARDAARAPCPPRWPYIVPACTA